jgi:RNA polymerase sigma factor (sigma-70 family)
MDVKVFQDIVAGDRDAYSRVYTEYFRKFYNYGRKFTRDISLIEDTIQEVFLDFWSKKEKLLAVANHETYFYSSFRYILLKKIKHAEKIVHSTESHDPEVEFSIDQLIIKQELNVELQQKLQSALKTLTARQREAIFLRFYEGFSYEEVAEVLNITVKATYKVMARSLSGLREFMQQSLTLLLVFLKV